MTNVEKINHVQYYFCIGEVSNILHFTQVISLQNTVQNDIKQKMFINLSKRIDYYPVFVYGFAIVSQIAETPVTTVFVTVRYWLSP